jgi:hypothetical protein
MPAMSIQSSLALAAVAVVGLSTSHAPAAVFGSFTVNNSTHYGYYGFASTSAQNTKARINAPFGSVGAISGTARVIRVSGTVTKVHPDAWLSSIQIYPSGGGLAINQPSWQFSEQRVFNGTTNVSATIYAPLGFNTGGQWQMEMFSLDAEQYVPGVDARSSLTFTFDNAFAPGSVEYSGALTANDPVFNRPAQYGYTDGFGNPQLYPPELTGAFPYYDVQPFHVATVGRYDLVSANEFESAAVLYAGAFEPSRPLQFIVKPVNQSENVLRNTSLNNLTYLDDATGASVISAELVPGVQYYFVTTAFNAPGIEPDGGPFVGRYNNLITGAGQVTLGFVPEPSALALAGAAGSLVLRRRRS